MRLDGLAQLGLQGIQSVFNRQTLLGRIARGPEPLRGRPVARHNEEMGGWDLSRTTDQAAGRRDEPERQEV